MANQTQTPPQQPPATQPPAPGAKGQDAPAPLTGPEPKTVTPLDPPQIFYNLKWRVAPLVVHTQEDADALDPNEWTQNPPPAAKGAAPAKPQFPKLYANVNLPPKTVGDDKEAQALGGDWQEFKFTEPLLKAGEANLKAQQEADKAKQAKAPPKPSAGGQAPAQQPQPHA